MLPVEVLFQLCAAHSRNVMELVRFAVPFRDTCEDRPDAVDDRFGRAGGERVRVVQIREFLSGRGDEGRGNELLDGVDVPRGRCGEHAWLGWRAGDRTARPNQSPGWVPGKAGRRNVAGRSRARGRHRGSSKKGAPRGGKRGYLRGQEAGLCPVSRTPPPRVPRTQGHARDRYASTGSRRTAETEVKTEVETEVKLR